MIGMLVFCMYTGYQCLTAPVYGLNLTVVNQLLQLISFTLFGFTYAYSAGIGLYGGVNTTGTTTFAFRFVLFKIGMGKADPDSKIFLINVIPILVLFMTDPLMKAFKRIDDHSYVG